jgi:aminoglycoside/choline kinase family phosphotransferase
MQERLIGLYRDRFGEAPSAVLALAGDGSSRAYRRLIGSGGLSVVGVMGPDHEENRAFLSFTRAFRGIDLPVPEVYAADEEGGVYLLEDLGDTTLFDALDEARTAAGGEFPDSIVPVYREVARWLPAFQIRGGRVVDFSVAYPRDAFDRQSILWDLNYFKYHFLKLAHVPFNEARLEQDFETLIEFLLGAERDHFLYRDFQSRNVMLKDGEPRSTTSRHCSTMRKRICPPTCARTCSRHTSTRWRRRRRWTERTSTFCTADTYSSGSCRR